MRLIDADDVFARIPNNLPYKSSVRRVLMQAGEVDAVPVVRCRDCKWYQEGKLLTENRFCFRLKHPKEDRKIGYNYAPDDFCSYGERKEKDHE